MQRGKEQLPENTPSWLTEPSKTSVQKTSSGPKLTRRESIKIAFFSALGGLFGGLGTIGAWEKQWAIREIAKSLSETSATLDETQEALAEQQGKNSVFQLKEQNCQEKLGEETSFSQATIAELNTKLKEAEKTEEKLRKDLDNETSQRAHWQAEAVTSETQKRVLAEALKGEINPQTLVEAGEAVVLSAPLNMVDDVQELSRDIEELVARNIEEVKDAAIPLKEVADYLNNKILPIVKFADKINNVLRRFKLQAVGSIIDTAVSILESVDEKTKRKFPKLKDSRLFLIEIGTVLKEQKEIPITPLEDETRSVLKRIEQADNKISAKTTDPVIDQVGRKITEYAQGIDDKLGKWAKETTQRLTEEKEEREAKIEAATNLTEFIDKNQNRILAAFGSNGMEVTPENFLKVTQELMGK